MTSDNVRLTCRTEAAGESVNPLACEIFEQNAAALTVVGKPTFFRREAGKAYHIGRSRDPVVRKHIESGRKADESALRLVLGCSPFKTRRSSLRIGRSVVHCRFEEEAYHHHRAQAGRGEDRESKGVQGVMDMSWTCMHQFFQLVLYNFLIWGMIFIVVIYHQHHGKGGLWTPRPMYVPSNN